eukprot:TRINITY_DN11803_c1_g1_i1.p1 TRINITY_DN11803_c1_g1~~TRINITY_DN11803_c1_g1_i1.p1  ORF type:complete len:319 (+),score=74.07 TRINITY_DN11803_c1_g1_i1:108-959(+)
MTEINNYMRRLQRIAEEVGVDASGEVEEEEKVDTSNMTAYEKGTYQATKSMAALREDIIVLDDVEKGKQQVTATQKAQITQRITRGLRMLRTETANLNKVANRENRISDYNELVKHVERTEELYKCRFRSKEHDTDAFGGFDSGGGGGAVPMKHIDQIGDQGDLSENLLDPRDDVEFQQFYQQSKQKDEQMDKMLDQVSYHLGNIKEQAMIASNEIDLHNAMLDNINEKGDKNIVQMRQINKKLKKTLKEVDKDKYCLYVICCLMLLGIIGVIVSQSGMLSDD